MNKPQGAQARNIDWNLVGGYYDAYVTATFDQDFFTQEAKKARGPVLELMCGTGRITLPLIEAGLDVTGLDSCPAFTARLRQKVENQLLSAEIVDADARFFKLKKTFALIFVGFHSFSELIGSEAKLACLKTIKEHLAPNGQLILTFYNPRYRVSLIHQDLRSMGTYPLPSGDSLEVLSKWHYDPATHHASGEQHYIERNSAGRKTKETVMPMKFDLMSQDTIVALAKETGFGAVTWYGDYQRSPYDEATSKFMIGKFSRAA